MYPIDRDSDVPMRRQLYAEIRSRILDGRHPAGWKLLPSRELARSLHVSRMTVVEAYEQLEAEGYVEAKVGDGSYVAPGAALAARAAMSVSRAAKKRDTQPGESTTSAGLLYRTDLIDFRTGLPELDAFPIAQWKRLTREVLDAITPAELAYGPPEGVGELREAVAGYLAARRGLLLSPENVVIVAGTTQAIGLITRLLVTRDRSNVIVEDPVTSDIRQIIASFGGRPVPVPVDDDGLDTARLPDVRPAFVYVTPSHHYPIGGILPARRRSELAEYAERANCWVVEDDYDSEYRFGGDPVGTLQELLPHRVIYIGTFSKTVFPGLRLAFVVLPDALVAAARTAKWHTDLHNPVVEQKTLARFVAEGYFERHIARSRRSLERRHLQTRAILEQHFGSAVSIRGAPAGLHLAATFPGTSFDAGVLEAARERGVKLYPASEHAANGHDWNDTLLFGYGMLPVHRIEEGIAVVREFIGG